MRFLITGGAGFIGSNAARRFRELGHGVVVFDSFVRAASRFNRAWLESVHPDVRFIEGDVRDAEGLRSVLEQPFDVVLHLAGQVAVTTSILDPATDHDVNALGTFKLLEELRRRHAGAPDRAPLLIYASTNKVYGDTPNRLPLESLEKRLELPESHRYFRGIDTSMSIDSSTHSLFGVSKAAADLLVQEYGRYFEMPTVCFRGGCLTGPQHAGAKLHGFLAYLMKCTVTGTPYTVFGYGGKQVRDNIHSADLVACFQAYQRNPRPAAVYNMGGGRRSNCSMLEAIDVCERVAGRELEWTLSDENRIGDHRWWISDVSDFAADYPDWQPRFGIEEILREMYEQNVERWMATAG